MKSINKEIELKTQPQSITPIFLKMSVSNKITKWVYIESSSTLPYISKSGSQTRINAFFIPKWRRYSLKSNEGTRYLESRYTLLILYDTGENGTSIKSLAKNSFLNIDKKQNQRKKRD